MLITRLEHAGLLLEAGEDRLAIDVGEFTTVEGVAALGALSALLVTHQHPDHFDEANIVAAGVEVAAPADVIARLPQALAGREIRAGEALNLAGFRIIPIPVDHGPRLSRPIDNYGLVVERAGRRLWILGDMAVPPPQPPSDHFDHLIISVDTSGYVFTPADAAAYVVALGHRGAVTPIHDGGEDDRAARDFARLAEGRFRAVLVCVGGSFAVAS
jgi:L-ascorbate metabolism protein UlaG (beta-lactamase superfamily)